MDWKEVMKKDKKDMRVGRVYRSDRAGKKIMMLTHEGKKIHAGAKGYGNYKRKERIAVVEPTEAQSDVRTSVRVTIATNARGASQLQNV